MAKSYRADYPVELIATLAVRLLDSRVASDDQRLFTEAAKRACTLLDVCEDVGQEHYKTFNNLQPLHANLDWAVEKITGIKGRPKYALGRFRKFFRSRVHLFVHPSDDGSIPPENPKSSAYKRMIDKLAKFERLGVDSDELGSLKTDYEKWRKDNTSEERSESAKKRKPKSPQDHSASDLGRTEKGKFKKKIA